MIFQKKMLIAFIKLKDLKNNSKNITDCMLKYFEQSVLFEILYTQIELQFQKRAFGVVVK